MTNETEIPMSVAHPPVRIDVDNPMAAFALMKQWLDKGTKTDDDS